MKSDAKLHFKNCTLIVYSLMEIPNGMANRLEKEITDSVPATTTIKIIKSLERTNSPWRGSLRHLRAHSRECTFRRKGGGGVTTKAIRLLCIANASEMAKWNSLCSDSVISTVFVNAVTQIKNTNDFIPISYTEHLINIPVRYLILAKKYCFIFFGAI